VFVSCLGPVNVCNSVNNNADKESARLLLTGVNSGGSIADNVITTDRPVGAISEQVLHASSAVDIELVSHASCESSIQGTPYVKEGGILQGRIAREPIDRARYLVVNGTGGTMFACSRCSKQYSHRKSVNKHWKDKHADDDSVSVPHRNLFNVTLVHCPSDTKHVALNCNSSLFRSAVCSPTSSMVPVVNSRQKIYSDLHRSQRKHSGTITDSVLWHSLTAIHLNQEHDMNSFHHAPLPAHNGGHYNAGGSFLNQMLCDDYQVLDLSKGNSDVHELSNNYAPDAPLDLSLKSNSMCLAASERAVLPLHGVVETVSKSAASYCKEISAADTLILNKPKRADNWVAKFGDSNHSDSVAVLRRLHSGILTSATNHSVLADSGSHNAVAFDSDELQSNHYKVEPSAKCECHPNPVHVKNNLKVFTKIPDDLATPEETHDFFGGISRGGHIRCKKCEFSAMSMLLFSRHVAQHMRKPYILSGISDCIQNQCDDGIDKLENKFFMLLGLYPAEGADCDQKSSGSCHCGKVDNLDIDEDSESRCKAVVTNVSKFTLPQVQANGFGNSHDDESGLQKKNCRSSSVRQKPGRYQRGLGLTTTESRDAAGRSWRRRRLRTCERCGYVTDNLTTLKRHEVKHGALGMYRCKLCDYTVNQQHILEYHTRNVHGLSRQIDPANSEIFRHTDTVLVDSFIDEHCSSTTATLVADDRQGSLSKDLSDTVSVCDSATSGGSGAFTCNSKVAEVHDIQCADNKYSMQKVMSKTVQYPTSVTVARRHLLDAFSLQLGRGICVRCGFRSLCSVRMKQHMLRHPHERHACSLCPHTSPTAQLLLKHKRQHTDCRAGYLAQKKTYQCPECPFIAASPNRLQCHTQFHGVKYRHVCGMCSYSVDRANLIAQHRRLHASASVTVLKRCWLHCNKCPFKTINRVTLVNHERGHYAINCRYMCSLCIFGTDVANVALGHQRLHSCVN